MLQVFLSRALNHYFFAGNPDEMLSSRIHDECWQCESIVDFIFFWHTRHCKLCSTWERRLNARQRVEKEHPPSKT